VNRLSQLYSAIHELCSPVLHAACLTRLRSFTRLFRLQGQLYCLRPGIWLCRAQPLLVGALPLEFPNFARSSTYICRHKAHKYKYRVVG